jgi:hypothetical protein
VIPIAIILCILIVPLSGLLLFYVGFGLWWLLARRRRRDAA